jgi:centrosomal protein CEP290
MYFDFAEKSSQWEAKEKQLISEANAIAAERDGVKLKLKRVEETIDLMQREDPSELEAKLREYSKKIAILEVNESVLSRRYTSISEQLSEEQATRRNIETDFAEMEGTLKRRIVQLEDYKAKAGRQLGFLQTMLDSSVPRSDYFCIQTELESLREDHLKALSRELDSRVAILKAEDELRDLAACKLKITFLDAELTAANAGRRDLVAQLEHQKEATRKAINALSSSGGSATEMGLLVSEMAKFRGEASRLEVELVAANRRNELLRDQLGDANRVIEELKSNSKQLSSQISQLESAEQAIRHECRDLRMKFEGGLTRKEAEDVQNKLKLFSQEQEELRAEVKKQTELAEIAAQQAQSLASFRDTYLDELKELRAHCMNLESRTDDDLLIGKLQRSLMSTKASYRAFAQKYQMVRSNLRQNEIALRVVETKLNEREEVVVQMHTNYRTELNALKTAIRSLWNMSDGDNSPFNEDSLKALSSVVPLPLGSNISLNSANFFDGFVPFGFRLQKFSDKISELASKASDYKTRAEVAERNCNEKEAILDDVSAERDILIKKCDDLVLVLSTSSANDTKQQQSVKAVAQRVSSLTEELKQLKLSNLQLKREVSTMKSEKKHLQTMLSNFEESVRALEKSKVTDETKQVVMDLMKQQSQSEPTGDDIIKKLQREAEVSKVLVEDNAPATDFPGRAGERLIIDNEEYLRNLEDAKNKYRDSQAELASLKSKLDAYQGRLVEAQNIIAEKDEQLNYCERVMVKEGLPSFKTGFSSVPRSDLRQSNMQKINPDQLQEAASNTIGSLKKLLAEKNETIEKYLAKIASLQEQLNDVGGGKRVSLADRRAEELLRKLQSEDERSSGDPSPRMARDVPVPDGVSEKFLRQIEEAEDLIKEKNRTISQLEQKLGVQENQRERAEMRCAAALQEMEAMKNDIILIAQQLQASEEKVAKLQQQALNAPDMSRPNVDLSASFTEAAKASKRPVQSVDPAKVNELKKAIKAKDEKLKSYRTIILRLKDEFIKAEEERAIREAGKTSDKKKGTNANDSSMIGNSAVNHELDELRSQVSALRDGLKQAKEDLDQARKGREKLVKAKQTAEEEAEKFEAQIARAEAQAAAAQEALQRCRKDLEDSRRKEVRLRDKLREMLAAQHVEDEDEEEADEHKADDTGSKRPQTAGGASSQTKSGQKIQALQREIDTLRVQNEALRKQNGATEGEPVVTSGAPDGLMVAAEKSTKEELRQQLHAKWESEKRLQKRVTVLEKRLQDKVQECDDAQAQLRKAKESLSSLSNSATAARERERKEREEKTRAASRAVPGGDLAQLEQANNRVFELENEVTALRRQVEVDHPSELNALRFQCDNLRARVGDLESQLKLVQERRRRTGAPSLREEEEMYLREERLRDDLEALRRQKQELESLLLDKDARIMTLSFDIDANAGELSRCRRRIRELETYCRELASKPGVPSGIKSAWAEADGAPGANRGKREKELEGAVEALKGVVEKLKQENDRLRRGIGAGGAETNRAKVEADRRKIEKLEEELEELRGKSTKQEDLSQKLVQKTQQIASLRKALKSKEDECNEANRRASDFEAERESLRQQLAEAKANIQKLDSHVASRITAQREAGANVGSAASEIAEWKRKANEAAVTIEDLKQKLVEARRENSSNRRGDFSSNAGLQSSAKEVEYQETIAKLKKENERLRQELSEFDLEFFEEIEDLKFAHAEAVKKLKQYELMDSRR